MSGHSHAKTVKRTKDAEDKKRSQTFSKIARLISVAVKEKGSNPETNPKLRLAIEAGRTANMPKENIERAIKKGTGEDKSTENLQEVIFEAFGPAGSAIIIEGITDNTNRTLGNIKQILNQYNIKLVGEGGVRWMFERKVDEAGIMAWVAKDLIEVSAETSLTLTELINSLEEDDAVQQVYTNLKKEG